MGLVEDFATGCQYVAATSYQTEREKKSNQTQPKHLWEFHKHLVLLVYRSPNMAELKGGKDSLYSKDTQGLPLRADYTETRGSERRCAGDLTFLMRRITSAK